MLKMLLAAAIAAQSSVSEGMYQISGTQVGECSAGKTCHVAVKIETRGDKHLNESYPLKFRMKETQNVCYEKQVLTRADAKFDANSVKFDVAFVPSSPGNKTIAGVLNFSVCDSGSCYLEKVDLDVDAIAR